MRSGPGPIRPTGTASTTWPARSRWICCTRTGSAGPPWPQSASRGLRFLHDAADPASGRFRNFRSIDGSWIGGVGSDDSYGRAMLALGDVIAAAPDPRLVDEAVTLFLAALPAAKELTFPRAQASVMLGCAATLESRLGGSSAAMLELLAARMHARFRRRVGGAWPWPESSVTYENALLPRAMIVAGGALASDSMLEAGLRVLDWLIDAQTATDGHLTPVGNGWWPRGGTMSQFDQQPIEPTALLLAAEAAYGATGDASWLAAMERCYAWFLGGNDLSEDVAVPARGACRDGLTRTGVNLNEGAESTLMWLIAVEHIRDIRDPRSGSMAAAEPVMAVSR